MRQQVVRQSHAFKQTTFPQAKSRVGDRRIVNNEMTFTTRRAIVINQLHRLFDELLCQFFGISNCRRGEDELRLRAVELGHALQSTDDIGNM